MSPDQQLQHCEPDVLALRALGEPAGRPEDDAHLATCATCRAELRALARIAGTSRSGAPVAVDAPSPRVWEGIAAELGLPADVVPREVDLRDVRSAAAPERQGSYDALADVRRLPTAEERAARVEQVARAERAARLEQVEQEEDPDEAAGAGRTEVSTSGGRDRRAVADRRRGAGSRSHVRATGGGRRRLLPALVAATLVGVLAGVGGTVLADRLGEDEATGQVLATTPLEPLPSWQAGGEAEVVELPDGQRQLRLDVSVSEGGSGEGFREVWLIDRDVTKLVSLGVLDGDTGTFLVPDGVDLADYPVVDVSLEPYDGQPAHSGDSIVRGILPT